jgi:hypothetical protein
VMTSATHWRCSWFSLQSPAHKKTAQVGQEPVRSMSPVKGNARRVAATYFYRKQPVVVTPWDDQATKKDLKSAV